jgi:hypothetical protein
MTDIQVLVAFGVAALLLLMILFAPRDLLIGGAISIVLVVAVIWLMVCVGYWLAIDRPLSLAYQ